MDTKSRLYLISKTLHPILHCLNNNHHYPFLSYNNRRQFYYLDLELSDLSVGFMIMSNNVQVEVPICDHNSCQNEDQKLFRIEQKGSYFIHQGQLHLIERDDNVA